MAYSAKDILNDIHRVYPVPTLGKMDRNSHNNSANKLIDSSLSDDLYKSAKFIYSLMTDCFGAVGKPLYEPSIDASNSAALSSLTESSHKSPELKTPLDLKFTDFSKKVLNNKKSDFTYANVVLKEFNFDIDIVVQKLDNNVVQGGTFDKPFGAIKNKADQTAFLRSANHCLSILEGKVDDFFFDGLSKKEGFDSFEKVFDDVAENYKSKTFNDDVQIGVSPYSVNAFANLISKSIKIINPVDNKRSSISITPIKIPEDKVDSDKMASLNKGESLVNSTVVSLVKSFLSGGVSGVMFNLGSRLVQFATGQIASKLKESGSIKDVASLMRLSESKLTLNNDTLARIAELHSEFQGKTVEDLENEWNPDSRKKLNQRDFNVLTDLSSQVKSGYDLKKYIDNNDNLLQFFDVISRQLYLSTNFNMTLLEWDRKQDDLVALDIPGFEQFISNEDTSRMKDENDLETYASNRNNSKIDVYLDELDELDSESNDNDDGFFSVENFEAKYPSLKNSDELARIINVVASASPESVVTLNDELGQCAVDESDINFFKYYNKHDDEVQNNLVDIYNQLNSMISTAGSGSLR